MTGTDADHPNRMNRVIPVRLFVACLLAVLLAPTVQAQRLSSSELLKRYLHARTAFLASRDASPASYRLSYRRPETLYLEGDTVRAWLEDLEHERLMASLPDPLPLFAVDGWEKISHLRAAAHKEAFNATQWAFTGSNSLSPIDTMRTADLRSRFQTVFGAPTVTLVESPDPDSLLREQVIQFEYWFLLNDSIRVAVLDVNGPWDRGVVLAADQKYRSRLPVIKRDFLEQLIPDAERTRFTDYYFNVDQRAWYLTGFDGASFFDTRIVRPDMTTGRPAPIRPPDSEPQADDNEPN